MKPFENNIDSSEKEESKMPKTSQTTYAGFLITFLLGSIVGASAVYFVMNLQAKSPSSQKEAQVRFNVVNSEGNPMQPDRAWWYYPPTNEEAKEYPAECTNSECTRWVVKGATSSKVYVAAEYKKKKNAYCDYIGYDAQPVDISTSKVSEATLRLDINEQCE